MSASQVLDDNLLLEDCGGFVHVCLNRPQALNALSWPMITGLRALLNEHQNRTILVSGAGGRAFCAGGDIKMQVQAIKAADFEAPRAYFKDEYGLNADLYHFQGQYVAYLNGITMGGGYGVSAHGSHIVATEATQFAMPEVKIGFFPDVGAAYPLARLPHELGVYLALTGNTIGAADMLYAGLAQAYIPLTKFDVFKAALQARAVDEVLADMHVPLLEDGILKPQQDVIARCFAFDTVEAILDALDAHGGAFALQTAADIRARSPLSVKIALRHLRMAATDDFDSVIARDLQLAYKFLENPDFAEGVRAAVIDKDRNPRWNPATLEGVGQNIVGLYFNGNAD